MKVLSGTFAAVLLAAGLVLCPSVARANGDPVLSYSANIRSCNPVPLKVSEVEVAREDLSIKVAVPYTSVLVKYTLKNSSKKNIHVDYGFPVDFSGTFDAPHGFVTDEWTESLEEDGIASLAVKDIKFVLDGKPLSWQHSNTVYKTGEPYYDEELEKTIEPTMCRLWTYTKLDIPAGSSVVLEISYSALCQWSVALGALKASPLSRHFADYACFEYDYTPAQHWGSGKAGSFNCTVDCSAVPKLFINKVSPSFYDEAPYKNPSPLVWTYNAKDFDFATAGNLQVQLFKDWESSEDSYISWGNPLKTCAIPASAYKVIVSGSQDGYPAANMSDGSKQTAWVAPGDGVGAVIDIDFPKPRRVSDICLWNGYHKSSAIWSSNSRIAKVRVEVTRADGYKDEPFDADLTDWDEHYYVLRDDQTPRYGEPTLLSVTNISRQVWGREVGTDNDGGIIYFKPPFESENVRHIRLTVLETAKGSKYTDLCLSELVLLDGFKD